MNVNKYPALLSIFLFVFFFLSFSEVFAASPTFTVGWKNGGSDILLNFDQWVFSQQGAVGNASTSDFVLGGASSSDPYVITNVNHTAGEKTVILTLNVALNLSTSSQLTVACVSSQLFNRLGEACGTTATDIFSAAQDTTGPSIRKVVFYDTDSFFKRIHVFPSEHAGLLGTPNYATSTYVLSTADGSDSPFVEDVVVLTNTRAFQLNATTTTITFAAGDTVQVSQKFNDSLGNEMSATTTQRIKPHLLISEVRHGKSANALDEFIEIYNASKVPVDLNPGSQKVFLHISSATGISPVNIPLNFVRTTIPPEGFFLIAPDAGYGGAVSPDATYDAASTTLATTSSVTISLSSAPGGAGDFIDRVGWGTSDFIEGPAAAPSIPVNGSIERKAFGDATADSMFNSGPNDTDRFGVFGGNAWDTDKNDLDFVVQASSTPQNSLSPREDAHPGTGDFQDIYGGNPYVVSMNPLPGDTNAPRDLPGVSFAFNEPVDLDSIATGTIVTFAKVGPDGQADTGDDIIVAVSENLKINNSKEDFKPPFEFKVTLEANTSYYLKIKGGSASTCNLCVKDTGGKPLNQSGQNLNGQNVTASDGVSFLGKFTVGSGTVAPSFPPFVEGTMPFSGSVVPPNIAKIRVKFSTAMATTTVNSNTIKLWKLDSSGNRTAVSTSGFAFDEQLDEQFKGQFEDEVISFSASLQASSRYEIEITTGVQSKNGIALDFPFFAMFETSASNDTTPPKVTASIPVANATGLQRTQTEIVVHFDDDLDPETVFDTDNVVLKDAGPDNTLGNSDDNEVPGVINYEFFTKDVRFVATNPFILGKSYRLTIKSGGVGCADSACVKNIVGTRLDGDGNGTAGDDYTLDFTVESTNTDTAGPALKFVRAHQSGLDIAFSEAVPKGDAELFSKYSLDSPTGTGVTLSANNGHIIFYDEFARRVFIDGLALTSGNTFTLTVKPLPDLIGNVSATSTFSGTVETTNFFTGGELAPPSGVGFVPSGHVFPFSMLPSVVTTYGVDMPITKQVPSGGKVVITFPTGFGVSLAKKDTVSPANSDINGPGAGTPTFSTDAESSGGAANDGVTVDTVANSISVKLSGATNSGGFDFMHFDLAGIKNSSIPRDFNTSGYTADIKTYDASGTLLESVKTDPFFILAGGTLKIRGQVTNADTSAGINGVVVQMFSPMTGALSTTTVSKDFGAGAANGRYLFEGLVAGDYFVVTEPFFNAGGTDYIGQSYPAPIRVNSTDCPSDICTYSFAVTPASSGASLGVKFVHSANTFGSSEDADVFAGGPSNFTVRTVTPGTGSRTTASADITTLALNQNGRWFVGAGPSVPKGPGFFEAPTTQPNWVMPKPLEVEVTGCPSSCAVSTSTAVFNIKAADKTLNGKVVDGTGKGISGAGVFAYSPLGGFGTHGQTSSDGSFSLKLVEGMFLAGVFYPGFPPAQEISIRIDSSGQVFVGGGTSAVSTLTLKLVKPDFKIEGKVLDEDSNVVQGASVYAYRTDAPGDVHAFTDASGAYTLYVAGGTWKVGAFVPNLGPIPEKTVVVSGASLSGINFAPSTSGLTFRTISGTVCRDNNGSSGCDNGEELSGVNVHAEALVSGIYRFNSALTNASGTYAVKIPANTGSSDVYTVRAFSPVFGELGKTTADVSSSDQSGKNIIAGIPRTITLNFSSEVTRAFIDVFDPASNLGNFLEVKNATTAAVQVPQSSAYILKISLAGLVVPKENISGTGYSTSTAVLTATANRTLTVTLPALATVSGTTYQGSTATVLSDAWVEAVNTSTGFRAGTKSDSNGGFSFKVPPDSYTFRVSKPGIIATPQTKEVPSSGLSGFELIVSQSDTSVSGSIFFDSNSNSSFDSGEEVANATVRALSDTGATVVTTSGTDGSYTLQLLKDLSWTISGVGDGFKVVSLSAFKPSAGVPSLNLKLTVKTATQNSVSKSLTPSSGGIYSNTDAGLEVVFPANSLGTSQSSAQITSKETTNVLDVSTTQLVGETGVEFTAVSSDGSSITTLSGEATLKFTKTKQQIEDSGDFTTTASLADLDDVKVAYFDDTTQSWVNVPTSLDVKVKDNAGDSFVSIDPATFVANLSSGADNPNASGTNTGIDYYADFELTYKGTFSHLTRFAVVSPAFVAGATASAAGGGGGGGPILSISLEGPLAPTVPPQKLAEASETPGAPKAAAGVAALPVYPGTLKLGMENSAIKAIQTLLASDKEIYPRGLVTGYFGSLTQEAVRKFQCKYDVVCSGSPATTGWGLVGPKTYAKLKEVFVAAGSTSVPTPTSVTTGAAVFTRTLSFGITSDGVRQLQEFLARDSEVYPRGLVTGYFGPLTQEAVKNFQCKHNLVCEGSPQTTGWGLVGPRTQAKLNELLKK